MHEQVVLLLELQNLVWGDLNNQVLEYVKAKLNQLFKIFILNLKHLLVLTFLNHIFLVILSISQILNYILRELNQTPDMFKNAGETTSEGGLMHDFDNFEESIITLNSNFVADELILVFCQICS